MLKLFKISFDDSTEDRLAILPEIRPFRTFRFTRLDSIPYLPNTVLY